MLGDIVITGIGCCTPFGVSAFQLAQEIQKSDVSHSIFRTVNIPEDLGGGEETFASIPGPTPSSIHNVRPPYPDRPTLMSFIAVDHALEMASLDTTEEKGLDVGLILNTCFGPSLTVERYLQKLLVAGPAQVSPIGFSRAVSNSIVGELSRRHNLCGPSSAVLGSSVIGYAMDLLEANAARAIICVGVDEVRDLLLWLYRKVGLFDGGLIVGEGAAAIVLEDREHAESRGAKILSVVEGYTSRFCSSSVHRITDVNSSSIKACMESALRRTETVPLDVQCIVSLANGHIALEHAEAEAVKDVIGHELLWLRPKRAFGETFGSSEVLGALVVTAMIHNNGNRFSGSKCVVNSCQIGGGVASLVIRN